MHMTRPELKFTKTSSFDASFACVDEREGNKHACEYKQCAEQNKD